MKTYRITVTTRDYQTERTSVFILAKEENEETKYYGDLSFIKHCDLTYKISRTRWRKVEDIEDVEYWNLEDWFDAINEAETGPIIIEEVSVSAEQLEELQRHYTADEECCNKSIPETMTMPVHGRLEYDGKEGMIDLGGNQRVEYQEEYSENEISITELHASDEEKASELVKFVLDIAERQHKRVTVYALHLSGNRGKR